MRITEYNLDSLRRKIECEGGFQIVILPIFPNLFLKVHEEAKILHDNLVKVGYEVLLDDRNQKPGNMFEVAAFLRIPHRLTLSGRSLEAGVYEYFNQETGYAKKIKCTDVLDFLAEFF